MLRSLVLFLIIGFLLTIAAYAQTAQNGTYRNPVIAGDFADPSVIRVGDTYYAAGTSSEWGPAYPIYTSKDLVNWDYVGPVFSTLPAWTMGSYWAPELFYRNGTFYVYYTARRKSDKHSYIGVATTTDLRKGFTDQGLIIEWTNEAIDAFIIEDAGKLYITWKAYGLDKGKVIELLGRELTPDGLKVTGEVFTILQADPNSWEAGGAEGQALFKRGKYFYMLYSGNNCCGRDCNYQVGVARAEKLQGPWERYAENPLLVSGDAWKCPGHGTVVTTPDNRYFYLHHGYDATDFTLVGRQGVLSELVWNESTGWPAFRYGKTTPAQADFPVKKTQSQSLDQVADFSKPNGLPLPWVWDVSKPKPAYRIEKGYLQVEVADNSPSPVAHFLGLTVKKGNYVLSAAFMPPSDVLQSICLYGDANNALGMGIRNDSVMIWQVKDGKSDVLQSAKLPPGKGATQLRMQTRQGRYCQFSWGRNGNWTPLNAEPIDGAFAPRWDRAPRIGISAAGKSQTNAKVKSVAVKYE